MTRRRRMARKKVCGPLKSKGRVSPRRSRAAGWHGVQRGDSRRRMYSRRRTSAVPFSAGGMCFSLGRSAGAGSGGDGGDVGVVVVVRDMQAEPGV